MLYDFSTTTHGKWILTGEHAVLRGCPAIIFPVASRGLTLHYRKTDSTLHIQSQGKQDAVLQHVFRTALLQAMQLINQACVELTGEFNLVNSIPISMGMGASAALCVAIGRWLIWQEWLEQECLYEFARELENLFHQESSGADIAACMANAGIFFLRNGERHVLQVNWQPIWFLSHSGKSSETAACVRKVKELHEKNPLLGQAIDAQMYDSVLLAEKALQLSKSAGMSLLKQAIDVGYSCFTRWGLTAGCVDQHIEQLRAAGAIAAKPTGSGDGGFILSLWDKAPPPQPFDLIAL
jgi:mevalonate kinase